MKCYEIAGALEGLNPTSIGYTMQDATVLAKILRAYPYETCNRNLFMNVGCTRMEADRLWGLVRVLNGSVSVDDLKALCKQLKRTGFGFHILPKGFAVDRNVPVWGKIHDVPVKAWSALNETYGSIQSVSGSSVVIKVPAKVMIPRGGNLRENGVGGFISSGGGVQVVELEQQFVEVYYPKRFYVSTSAVPPDGVDRLCSIVFRSGDCVYLDCVECQKFKLSSSEAGQTVGFCFEESDACTLGMVFRSVLYVLRKTDMLDSIKDNMTVEDLNAWFVENKSVLWDAGFYGYYF